MLRDTVGVAVVLWSDIFSLMTQSVCSREHIGEAARAYLCDVPVSHSVCMCVCVGGRSYRCRWIRALL